MKKQLINSQIFLLSFAGLLCISYINNISYLLPLILAILFIYLKYYYQKLFRHKVYNYLGLSLLLVIIVVLSRAFVTYSNLSLYYLPVAAVSMLCTILFNDIGLTFVLALAASLSAGIIAGGALDLTCVLFIGGITCGLLVLNLRRRSQIIKAGIFAGLMQAGSVIFIKAFNLTQSAEFIMPNFLNCILSGIFVSGALPIFEYLFDVTSNITLLELSDFNRPLLKRMVLEAPGTYHHSLVVGNLSEAAAEFVGANSLLARIGAYYHDIGKIDKAEYFIENQTPENVATAHEQLKPSVSKLVIMNHVKEGIDLGKKHKLNHAIIDFIAQHHGTSLVFYFYCRALENEHSENEIQEEGFRYSGPKPQTKEAAIILLADSAEGAARALSERTPKKISELVRKVINNKFIDGQLDECDLSLSDLEKIASIFTKILSAVYHVRITYPEKSGENNHKQSAE